jgi:hypothetical protein
MKQYGTMMSTSEYIGSLKGLPEFKEKQRTQMTDYTEYSFGKAMLWMFSHVIIWIVLVAILTK